MIKSTFKKQRALASILFFAVLALIGVVVLALWLFQWRHIKNTSDAYVQGNKVVLTPLVDGFVTGIYSDDTFLVEKGQLLIQLDPSNALLSFEESLENYANKVREVCGIFHQVSAYLDEIQVKEAEWIKAQEFYQHRLEVLGQGAISLEDFQASEAKLEETFYQLSTAQNLYQKEVVKIIGRSIKDNPIVKQAADQLSQAWINLYRCKIYSPVRGLVAERNIQLGMWVDSGTPLLSVIPLDQIWVNANFKETQMKHIKIGQKVKLHADMYGKSVPYEGCIVGLPGGAGNAFSILPPQNLSGNWIKIVQRLPVRVQLDPKSMQSYPLRIGMTMHAKVDLRQASGGYLPQSDVGSPTYTTEIYQDEIQKSKQLIEDVFFNNVDHSLKAYIHKPYFPER